MKKIRLIILSLIIVSLLASCAGSNSGETVATIGDETVTAGEVRFMTAQNIEAIKTQMQSMSDEEKKEYWNTDVDGKKPVDLIKESSLEYLISYAAFVQAAKEENITVSDSEVKTRMNSAYSSDDLAKFKENYGVSNDSVKQVIRKQLFQQKYVSRILEGKSDYTPTEEQLLNELKENYYKAQHILISTKDVSTGEAYSAEKIEEARKKAENILKKIRNGEDFYNLMIENSEDPGVKASPDGYVFTKGEMVQEFQDATEALEINAVSDIVESSYGYHIIKRLPVTDSDLASKETELVNSYKNKYIEKFVEELKAKYEVKQDDAKLNEITVDTGF